VLLEHDRKKDGTLSDWGPPYLKITQKGKDTYIFTGSIYFWKKIWDKRFWAGKVKKNPPPIQQGLNKLLLKKIDEDR